ncbi:substrate-binding domain-containing protein [Streptomyces sp. NPDC008150]|uniref:LacI family DNA-binding transcriptional regulator n=1 Tax=Streptomyces sp. NPDC008150 TaxID=3364816 RepID=UPI0036E1D708
MVHTPGTPASPTPALANGFVPTSADVARRAGVSRATVSYVLNNTAAVRISEPTRRRVREAAQDLGYVPHAAARSLRAGRSRLVLLPAQPGNGTLYHRLVAELQEELGRLDYTVVQCGAAPARGDRAARAWAELRPAAVIVPASSLEPDGLTVLARTGVRVVLALGPQAVEGTHTLLTDHESVGRLAAEHLYERGRRRIGVVLPREAGLDDYALPRLRGVRAALRDTDAAVTELPLAHEEEDAARLAARWRGLGLDGVFAYSDEYAMLLMRALQDEGVAVPGDTAVVGAGDLMLGRLLRPRLSTVGIDLTSCRALAELVDRAVRDPACPRETHRMLRVGMVPRESS